MKRILIVEHYDLNRDVLQRRLTRRGCDVVVAGDGREGLGLARTSASDLILMDRLPGGLS